ncbi:MULTISPECIES: ornithine carbamoyltransferase [Staphylococcus]|uniref:ornithine carbamoyltransferase n=1 Tax=Staphylococcus TaxID=1279 RepID=UPI0012F454EB|nr:MULTISPECIES: ornithine carbamoyltransferase [Staphylococcus]MBM6506000.1 ornithine carbamoyltransferase [Staphylococcus pasteuri]QQT19924.1 ornithine carbamoyltransferase [Staphylococcus pasteuri]VXC88558.1 ornithine carbamoyltransferase 1 [Staphylococcus sp. 8AQ]
MREFNFEGKCFLKSTDYTKEELNYIIEKARLLKDEKKNNQPHQLLTNKNIAIIFEKPSTRTLAAFSVAAHDLGMNVDYFGQNEIHLGKKESIYDTAKVLGSMYDGIEFRGHEHDDVETLARYANVPVWNGLTNEWHPTQMLADFMTLKEEWGTLEGKTLTFIGDAQNNVASDLLVTGALLGVNVNIVAPTSRLPQEKVVTMAKEYAQQTGATIQLSSEVDNTIYQTDALYTDVWFSMGEPENVIEERVAMLKPYQVNMSIIKKVQNPNVKVLHCLPAFHNTQTKVGNEVYQKYGLSEMEITDEVFNSSYSIIFKQAENRLHSIKAIMALTLGGLK